MVKFRTYSPEPFFTDDYFKVREFLARINTERIYYPRLLWGAWEWAVTHRHRDNSKLGKIGLWEDNDTLVGLATYETRFGEGFLVVDEAYEYLKPELVAYAKANLHNNGKLIISLTDGDTVFQRAAMAHGFRPTQVKDRDSIMDIDAIQPYSLPAGFSFVSLADDWDWRAYNRIMWRGFYADGTILDDDKTVAERERMLSSPMIIPSIVIAVAAPDGSYVSHCGMWYRPGDTYCYVEPVATDPDYRLRGLGKAAVLEGVRRCGLLGAKQAIVGSEQQFYYNIGFYPVHNMTHWELT